VGCFVWVCCVGVLCGCVVWFYLWLICVIVGRMVTRQEHFLDEGLGIYYI